ncbi:uncharacterized protein LOC143365199 [Halictus rubicundus]|uniref:uncharacterized protein LOC143365199 n=1 Tax=Halictus rubicundus TaxID=77578 RepID=UPI004035DA8A
MAIVDMHENVSIRATGPEPVQEEVQLTELLPVKQSRIRQNGFFANTAIGGVRGGGDGGEADGGGCEDDAKTSGDVHLNADGDGNGDGDGNNGDVDATTDALKVLRSFNENEQQLHVRNSFLPCERIDHRRKQESEKRSGRVGKSATDGKGNDAVVGARKKQKDIARKNDSVLANSSKKGTAVEGFEGGEGDLLARRRTVEENHDRNEKSFVFSVYGHEEDAYPTFDESKDFGDEIYAFRQDSLDLNVALDPMRGKAANRIYSPGTDGSLFDRGFDHGCDPDGKTSGFNIEAIIAANYFLESENNNVLRSSPDKVEGICESSLILADKIRIDGSSPDKNEYDDEDDQDDDDNSVDRDVTGGRGADGDGTSSTKDAGNEKGREGGTVAENEEKKYSCVVCEARFKGSGGLRNHYKIVHGTGPIFKCDECGKEFPLKERLKLHVRTHTGFKPYKCPECEKSFARGGQLAQHRRSHSQVKPYRCGLCSGTFTCAANLALHVKRHNGQKDHKCEICGRAFVRRDALKKHLECLHRDVKSFLCVICNKTFKGHLPQHMRTHAHDRPHGCATCGQRFAQKSQLTVHQRTHSGQRPFRCLVCWQAFAHSTALKLHTRRHTGERPFKCAECNAGFTQLPHWKKHMKCIHGRTEPYACKRCKSFFRIKNDLDFHEKTCHPELVSSNASTTNSANADSFFNEIVEKPPLPSPPPTTASTPSKYKTMSVERMRLLLAVLLKRISKQERLDELGFGKRLIDEVLRDSLLSAGKNPVPRDGLTELESLTKNLEIFLKWTVPKEHWENFCKLNKSPEDILETLTAT